MSEYHCADCGADTRGSVIHLCPRRPRARTAYRAAAPCGCGGFFQEGDFIHADRCNRDNPCDMGALLRAAVAAHRAAHPGTSQAAIARLAGIAPESLSRAFGRPDAEPATVRAVCRALGLRVELVPV